MDLRKRMKKKTEIESKNDYVIIMNQGRFPWEIDEEDICRDLGLMNDDDCQDSSQRQFIEN